MRAEQKKNLSMSVGPVAAMRDPEEAPTPHPLKQVRSIALLKCSVQSSGAQTDIVWSLTSMLGGEGSSGGHRRAIPTLSHRDASHALSNHARRSQAVAFGPRTADGARAGRVYLRRLSISPAATLTLKAGLALAASHGKHIYTCRRR